MNTAPGYFPAMIFVALLAILWLAFTAYSITKEEGPLSTIYYAANGDWHYMPFDGCIGTMQVSRNHSLDEIQLIVDTALAEQEHQL